MTIGRWLSTSARIRSRSRNRKDVKDGVIAYKIAGHAADLAKGHPRARVGRRAQQGALQVPLGGPGGGARPLLLDVRAHFCSMKITQDVREYAATHGIAEETAVIVQGLREKAEEFSSKGGGEIYWKS